MTENLGRLVAFARRLGNPSLDLVVLAEGNTSCTDGPDFWVKSSGASLSTIEPREFSKCRTAPLIGALEQDLSDENVKAVLHSSSIVGSKPSVEAFMHAYLLSLPGIEFVGHVHPTAVLSLVCSPNAQQLCSMRFFPDEVVCCGVATAWVPYVDPGLELAKRIRHVVEKFIGDHGEPPKVMWLQNHGLTALGRTPEEVESALVMNTKVARLVCMAGGLSAVGKDLLVPLSPNTVSRIRTRPDEHYRQERLWGTGSGN